MKQKLCILLAVVMLMLCITPGVSADGIVKSGVCGENTSYTLDANGHLVISGTGSIDSMFFNSRLDIITLEIQPGVTAIGAGAFSDCPNLTGTVVIPDSVTTLNGEYGPMDDFKGAFDQCASLTGLVIGSGVTVVPDNLCNGCTSLRTLVLPDTITLIGRRAFQECRSLEQITFPASLTAIGDAAFAFCTSLTGKLVIPDHVTDLCAGEDPESSFLGIFCGCTGLTEVVVGSGITIVPYGTFNGCENLQSVTLSEGLTTIGSYAFSFCNRLPYVEIPASVRKIGELAFVNDFSLSAVVFKGDAPVMGSAFYCSGFNTAGYYPSSNPTWSEDLKGGSDLTALVPYETDAEGNRLPVAPDSAEAEAAMVTLGNKHPEGSFYSDNIYYIINADFLTGYGSEAFAFQVSDALCGYLPTGEKQAVDFEALNPGDVLYLNGACCTVTAVNGDTVTVAGVENEVVSYGRTLTRAQVESAEAVRARIGVAPHPGHIDPAQDLVLTDLPTTLPTEQQVYDKLLSLQEIFPEGMPYSSKNHFSSKTEAPAWTENGMPASLGMTGHGCSAFGYYVSDLCFGNLPAYYYPVGQWNYEDLKVGDQLMGLGHQVIILEDHEDHIVVVEGNYDETIHWFRTMTREECLESFSLYTRYPENYPFTDVPEGVFYSEPVAWAVENGITTGASETTFNPTGECMRAHVVTFLWRAAGQPEPASTVNPFVDVKEGDFYYKAVLWAVENGITNGVDATHFGPTVYCNRAQVVTFLYRAMGSPEVSSDESAFNDVDADQWYAQAVLWAVENAVTNGMSADTFGTTGICNRAQVVTFLYRTYVD